MVIKLEGKMTLDFLGNSGFLFWVIPIFGIAVGAIYFYLSQKNSYIDFNIQRKSKLLSPAEKAFFECLFEALEEDFYIFAKVSVLDVVESNPSASKKDDRLMLKKLKGECFDYVMCKKHDLSIFGVVELENFDKRVSTRRSGENREELISRVCRISHLRLFYFDIRQDYKGVDIRRLVTGRSGKHKAGSKSNLQASQLTIDNSSYAAYAKQRSCPKCNGEVVTKVAVKGKNVGEKFLMCRKYPYCDYRVGINDAKVVDMDRHQERENKKPGYSDWSAG